MTDKNKKSKLLKKSFSFHVGVAGAIWYLLVVIVFAYTPLGFEVFHGGSLLSLISALFVGALGLGYVITSSNQEKNTAVSYAGAILLGVLFTGIGVLSTYIRMQTSLLIRSFAQKCKHFFASLTARPNDYFCFAESRRLKLA